MQAELQKLESNILAHVAKVQGKSAREAAASLGLTLRKEGVSGVTEEVRCHALRTPCTRPREPWACTVPHCQLPSVCRTPVTGVGGMCARTAVCWERSGQPVGPWRPA